MQTQGAAGTAATDQLNSPAVADSGRELKATLAAQHRRRRLRFWAGFLAILVIGGLWAGLTKDPVGPGWFEGDFAEPAVADEVFLEREPAFITTTAQPLPPPDLDPPTTVPSTTVPPTTAPPTTEGP